MTPEVVKKILDALRVGASQEVACAAAGIGRTTYCRWLKEPEYADFQEQVEAARAECEVGCLAKISLGKSGWQGSCWIIERTRPLKYSLMYHRMEKELADTGFERGPAIIVRLTTDDDVRGSSAAGPTGSEDRGPAGKTP